MRFKLSSAMGVQATVDAGSIVQCNSEQGVCVGSPTAEMATPCIHNSTHCQCSSGHKGGLCLRFLSGTSTTATCIVEECLPGSHKCDCMGEHICALKPCGRWTSAAENKLLIAGSTVPCSYLDPLSPDSGMCATLLS